MDALTSLLSTTYFKPTIIAMKIFSASTYVLTGILITVALTFIPNTAHAVTLHWGSAAGDFIYESDGTSAVDPGSFNFELGTFSDGFDPSANPLSSWASNWHRLDIGTYNSTTGFLTGSVTLNAAPAPDGSILDGNATDTASFFFGKDAYVWIYNQNSTVDETLEWVLLANPTGDGSDPETAWTFPTAGEADARSDVIDFRISDPGVTPLFGGENKGTPSTGDGISTGTPTTFALQTFTIIPEPSSTFLLALGVLTLFARRKQSI